MDAAVQEYLLLSIYLVGNRDLVIGSKTCARRSVDSIRVATDVAPRTNVHSRSNVQKRGGWRDPSLAFKGAVDKATRIGLLEVPNADT